MTKKQAEIAAREIVTKTCVVNGAIAWVPLSTLPLTFSEGLMVRRIGRVFEATVDDTDVSSVIGAALGGTVGHAAGEVAKAAGLVVIHPVIAAGIVKAIGEVAISYFARRSPLA